MVGKGVDTKSSRIFHQCYLKCCKLQNLTPLNNVIPTNNGKVVDFCVDRIKYAEWAPILNALCCDLSLHSISIRCRQQVKTVLEHIDCERLAKTVTKRAVILTNFMLTNLMEAIAQMLSGTTLLTTLLLEGLPLKIPYLNPLCEALLANSSLQHLYLPRCLIGDAGCLAICKAVRCLPNILTLDLSGCEITPLGAGYLADLLKYQKIHRYSENWVHTLRYRLPELDAMAGLRRITLCGNMQLTDRGFTTLADVLADDLWIKALDVQNCGLTEQSATVALRMMQSNSTLVVLDLRHNPDVSSDSMSKLRTALRNNDRGVTGQYTWLSSASSDVRSVKSMGNKNGVVKERVSSNVRNISNKYSNKINAANKEKDYTEVLEEQLQEEISHRQQLEELNLQLINQMKQLKQQQMRLWANAPNSSGSEQSLAPSSLSGEMSSSSGSSRSVPIEQSTLSYIQQAFRDIYAFIKNNQCHGQCHNEKPELLTTNVLGADEAKQTDLHAVMLPKKAQSTPLKLLESARMKKITKSAHLLGDIQNAREELEMNSDMFEKQMGDTRDAHVELSALDEFVASKSKREMISMMMSSQPNAATAADLQEISQVRRIYYTAQAFAQNSINERSPCGSVVSDSSDTLVCSPAPNPRDAFTSSDEEDDSD